jgi:type I restriction enzyme M protein
MQTFALGDTIEDPQHTEGGSLRKFDRIIANPPFSQNYSKDNIQFPARFRFGYAPETGKKGDLMFVQHMIACLKDNGKMACIIPHGVLFRGGAEKVIREKIVKDNLVEAIIALPPSLVLRNGHSGLRHRHQQKQAGRIAPQDLVRQCRCRVWRRQSAKLPSPGRH